MIVLMALRQRPGVSSRVGGVFVPSRSCALWRTWAGDCWRSNGAGCGPVSVCAPAENSPKFRLALAVSLRRRVSRLMLRSSDFDRGV